CCDITEGLPFPPASFDAVLARGCSHYHYDLQSEQALETTSMIMSYLRPGGLFVMVIVTDLSGRREPGKIWQNKIEDYRRHFSSFDRRWSVDWVSGTAICGLWNTPLGAEAFDPAAGVPPGCARHPKTENALAREDPRTSMGPGHFRGDGPTRPDPRL
ncbi:MAG: class I SAM-dependent methyltransferase, partial [Planctomycetes bacterium]|nr:class I SAM-dependent methyltransferase [Planctomycetota bacterium]